MTGEECVRGRQRAGLRCQALHHPRRRWRWWWRWCVPAAGTLILHCALAAAAVLLPPLLPTPLLHCARALPPCRSTVHSTWRSLCLARFMLLLQYVALNMWPIRKVLKEHAWPASCCFCSM